MKERQIEKERAIVGEGDGGREGKKLIHANEPAYAHTPIHIHTHIPLPTHRQTDLFTQTHPPTHTPTHTHTHNLPPTCQESSVTDSMTGTERSQLHDCDRGK